MGQSQSKEQIQQKYQIVQCKKEGMLMLKHKNNGNQHLLRTFSSFLDDQVNGFESLIQKRKLIKCSHLLQVIELRKEQQKRVCSMLHKLHMLIEYPFKTLQDQIQERSLMKNYFHQNELWSIFYSCCVGLKALYAQNFTHQALSASQIYIDREGIIKISDPLLLGIEKNFIIVLKNSTQKVHLSPQIMNFLEDCNFFYYEKQKSDLYILGMIILEAATLENLTVYDRRNKKPNLQIVEQCLKRISKKYSQSLVDAISLAVSKQPKSRPSLSQIIRKIEQKKQFQDESNVSYQENSRTTTPMSKKYPPKKFSQVKQINKSTHRLGNQKVLARQRPASQQNLKGVVNSQAPVSKQCNYMLSMSGHNAININYTNNVSNFNTIYPNNYHNYGNDPKLSIKKSVPIYQSISNDRNKFNNITIGYQSIDIKNYSKPTSFKPLFSHQIPEVNSILQSAKQPQKLITRSSSSNFSYPTNLTANSVPNLLAYQQEYSSNIQFTPQPSLIEKVGVKKLSNYRGSQAFQCQTYKKNMSPIQLKTPIELNRSPKKRGQTSQEKYCVQNYNDGGRYEGFKIRGAKNGQGRFYYKNGGFYDGNWKDNKMNGFGKLYYQSGQIAYEGTWLNDQFSGEGRHFNDNPENFDYGFNPHDFTCLGNKWLYYQGNFQSDSKHGKGKIQLANGESFTGEFIYDMIEGLGVYQFKNGQSIKGIWKQNKLLSKIE